MNTLFDKTILEATGATELYEIETVQELWSGYGKIIRYGLIGSDRQTVIVKHVRLPKNAKHPRGWDTDLSHQRKLKSYQVEMEWYGNWAERCFDACRVPHCLVLDRQGDEVLMVLEDLDTAGFPIRRTGVSNTEMKACLSWLANFHATFMGDSPDGLWQQGTYWHLETRPDELAALTDIPLKDAAAAIDLKLKSTQFQTLVHGDAKLANFCFSPDGESVAAVDFQYVGGGCGMKDVAYFIGSCCYDSDCETMEGALLDAYFNFLRTALKAQGKEVNLDAIVADWRALYPVAWTDFHRFLKGWSPGHWKINSYSERLASEVVAELNH